MVQTLEREPFEESGSKRGGTMASSVFRNGADSRRTLRRSEIAQGADRPDAVGEGLRPPA